MNKKTFVISLVILLCVGIFLALILPTISKVEPAESISISESTPQESESESESSVSESKDSASSSSEAEITESQINAQKDIIYENALRSSHTAVVCNYVGKVTSDGLEYHKFTYIETVYGNADAEDIYVDTYDELFLKLIEGEKYLLTLKKEDAVYHTVNVYEIVQGFQFSKIEYPVSNFDFKMRESTDDNPGTYGALVTISGLKTDEDLINYVKELASELGYDEYDTYYKPNIFYGENLETVLLNCDFVIKVKIDSTDNYDVNGQDATRSYTRNGVTILNVLRGEGDVDIGAYLNTKKGAVEVGKEYIIAVAPAISATNSFGFMQCAENGIIPVYETEKLNEVFEILGISQENLQPHISPRITNAVEKIEVSYEGLNKEKSLERLHDEFIKDSFAAVSVVALENEEGSGHPFEFMYVEDIYSETGFGFEETIYIEYDDSIKDAPVDRTQYLLVIHKTDKTYLDKEVYKCTLAVPYEDFYNIGEFTFTHTLKDSGEEVTLKIKDELWSTKFIFVFQYLALKYGIKG
ncbi:MAG: hypothetical protein E7564_01245 [Ruminococcaceae bacterium]|nr:hypothetical protein [Oscillospiraceae bacterium]